jgi:hypothetical protein
MGLKMKASPSQLKSFLRTCKNAYITIDLGNGPMMIKVIKSAIAESISAEEYEDSTWHYEFIQTDAGLDLKLGEEVITEEEAQPFSNFDSHKEESSESYADFSNSDNDIVTDSSVYHE